MAISEKQKQKKLLKKNKKRKLIKKTSTPNLQAIQKASNYAKFPIYECLIPKTLFKAGIGTIVVTRQEPAGTIAISSFVVDVFCLGVKDALFKVISVSEYEDIMRPRLADLHGNEPFDKIEPACARKLVEGAVSYAKELGFSPHEDYHNAKGIFGDIENSECQEEYNYGKEGKPFYIRGPHESMNRAKQIIDQLHNKCGEENYDYIAMLDKNMD